MQGRIFPSEDFGLGLRHDNSTSHFDLVLQAGKAGTIYHCGPSADGGEAALRAEACLSFSACEQERRLLVAGGFETVVELPAIVNLDFISGLF